MKNRILEKLEIPEKIETDRLILRKHEMQDGARMFQTVEKNRSLFDEFLPWVKTTKSQADTDAYIASALKHWAESTGFDFSILIKDSNQYIGNLGLHTVSLGNLRGEFGYWLSESAQGKGYMAEAVKAYEEVCFNAGLNRLEIRCAPSNKKSARIPQKLGYVLEGRLRENHVVNGEAQDTLVFSKLKTDLTPC